MPATQTLQEELLCSSAGHKRYEVAFEVGVSRSTLHRWMTKDAAFIAAYNTNVNDSLATVRARLRNGLVHAADTVLRDIRTDRNLAYKMLKDAGLTKPEGGAPCVEELRVEMELAARRKEVERHEEKERLERTELMRLVESRAVAEEKGRQSAEGN